MLSGTVVVSALAFLIREIACLIKDNGVFVIWGAMVGKVIRVLKELGVLLYFPFLHENIIMSS